MPPRRSVLVPLVLFGLLLPAPAAAIPVFARKYKVTCAVCHNPVPKLTAFGEQFAANGFRFAPDEAPRDTINTGDPLLELARVLPLAMRLDAYAQAYAGGRAATDFQTPYGLKIMSSGTISKKLSYYFYTFLAERGEVGGIEDAFLQINDIGGRPLDVAIGQFQVSDPLFKREVRLEYEDYAVYRARLGDSPVDLTYDRGIVATADVAGFGLTGQILNGNGTGPAQDNRRFDGDPFKSLFLHVGRDIGDYLHVGGFGYTGKTESDGVASRTRMFGFDATIGGKTLELNGQYLHRSESRPLFTPADAEASLDGGFAELIIRPPNSRWYGFGLYNLVTADQPLLDVRLGGTSGSRRYETITGGFGRAERRNFRWTFEASYDTQEEVLRWGIGLLTAF